MRTQIYDINLVVGAGIPPIVKVSQNDELRVLAFRLFDGIRAYFPGENEEVTITGTKPSGLGFTEVCTINGALATVETTLAMTQESGRINAELRISDGSLNVGTANFVLYVEPAPHPAGTTDGTTEEARTVLEQCAQYAQEAHDAASDLAPQVESLVDDAVAAKMSEIEDAVQDVTNAATQAVSDINAAGAAVEASIPQDYTALSADVTQLQADLQEFGLRDENSAFASETVDVTETEDTTEFIRIQGSYKKGRVYKIVFDFNSVTWKSNGSQFLQIGSYSANSIAGAHLVDSIRAATEAVVGNKLILSYTPSTDTVVMIGCAFYFGSGEQNVSISVTEAFSNVSENIVSLLAQAENIMPLVESREESFSGTISSSTAILYVPYNFYKNCKYNLKFECILGSESSTNCLRVHTASAQNSGSAYKKDVINSATSLNPFCGQINDFGTGNVIDETFVAKNDAKYLVVLYYGTENTNYQIKITVGRIASVQQSDNIIFGRGVVSLNKDVEPFVLQLGREISEQTQNHSYKRLNFLFFSDIHANGDLWERVCDYMDEYSDIIPFAIHCGDYVSSDLTANKIVDLYALRKPQNGAILNTVGNHDCYPTGSSSPTATAETVYDVLYNSVNPETDGWDCTFGTDSYSMYWYKDIDDAGVRIICLDQYHWDSDQSTFFANALSGAVTAGYAVITVTHTPITTNVNDVGTGFFTLDDWVLSDTYSGSMVDIRAAINTFISNGGVHLIHLCGHIHSDQFGKLTTDNILQFRTQMAGAGTSKSPLWTDTNRVVGTKTYDCFNVVQIDRNLGMIKIVRIGCNTSDALQPRTTLCWDYINSRLVANN